MIGAGARSGARSKITPSGDGSRKNWRTGDASVEIGVDLIARSHRGADDAPVRSSAMCIARRARPKLSTENEPPHERNCDEKYCKSPVRIGDESNEHATKRKK